jgi:hypothetical protein
MTGVAPSRFIAEAMNIFFRIDNKLMNFREDKFVSLCEPKARLFSRESLRFQGRLLQSISLWLVSIWACIRSSVVF